MDSSSSAAAESGAIPTTTSTTITTTAATTTTAGAGVGAAAAFHFIDTGYHGYDPALHDPQYRLAKLNSLLEFNFGPGNHHEDFVTSSPGVSQGPESETSVDVLGSYSLEGPLRDALYADEAVSGYDYTYSSATYTEQGCPSVVYETDPSVIIGGPDHGIVVTDWAVTPSSSLLLAGPASNAGSDSSDYCKYHFS